MHGIPSLTGDKYEQTGIRKVLMIARASVDHDRVRGHARKYGMAIGDMQSSAMDGGRELTKTWMCRSGYGRNEIT